MVGRYEKDQGGWVVGRETELGPQGVVHLDPDTCLARRARASRARGESRVCAISRSTLAVAELASERAHSTYTPHRISFLEVSAACLYHGRRRFRARRRWHGTVFGFYIKEAVASS